MIVDLFAGPGGWDEGLRLLDHPGFVVGVEHDADACATRAREGHATVRASVDQLPAGPFAGRVDGLIASPPCPTFSRAGNGAGMLELPHLVAHVHACRDGWRPYEPPGVVGYDDEFGEPIPPDPRSRLVLEPLRWVGALRPRWVALEEVPDVLPIWSTIAEVLRAWGYRTWCGTLNAADFGVPQTRERAFLLAALDRQPLPPEPTHCRGGAQTLLGELLPWVSMAEALGWGLPVEVPRGDAKDRADGTRRVLDTGEPAPTVCGSIGPAWAFPGTRAAEGRVRSHRLEGVPAGSIEVGFPRLDDRGDSPDGYRERDWRPATEPAQTIGEKARSMVVRTGTNSATVGPGQRGADWRGEHKPYERSVDEPAPTLDGKAGGAWKIGVPDDLDVLRTGRDSGRQERPTDQPAPAVTGQADGWAFDRPATTVQGDSRLWPPGHKVNADDERRLGPVEAAGRYGDRRGSAAIRLDVEDAAVLQSFPRGYGFVGTKTSRFRQVGNAVPPLLAAHVLRGLL